MFNNIEKYKDEIKEILNKNRNFALIDGEIKDCILQNDKLFSSL